jgi:pyruvate/2-oxoglutarate dehydrogenase complex dihydrolipoamide dehydrogenase (E3) component
MTQEYDIIAIGAGSAGIGAAAIANSFGLKALLIEKEDFKIGGDCLNFGCVPSKALIHIARQFQGGKNAEAFGLQTSGKADFGKVMAWVHEQQNVIRQHENAAHFRKKGIEVALGTAFFVNPKTVEVNGQQFTAKKIVLATGSKPRQLNVPGIELVATAYDNESLFWKMKTLPERMLVIGGGPIGCEMAQTFQRFGTQVTIINKGERLLAKELPAFSAILSERLEQEGVKIYHNSEVTKFTDASTAIVKFGNHQSSTMPFDAVLVSIGRIVRTEGIGLEVADIEVDEGKIVVDDYYRTTNPQVYAIGDAMGREQFSHGAEKHNRDLVFNFVSPIKKKHRLQHFSWVTYTEPEVATFGYTEGQLKDQDIPYHRLEQSFQEDDRAITADYRYGQLVLYFSQPHWLTRKVTILGGTMIAPYAGEIIQELILANQEELSINAIFNKIYPYPTMSRINQKGIMQKRQRETADWIKGVLGWLYRR